MASGSGVTVEQVRASAYTVPTESPKADGSHSWDKNTLILIELTGGDRCGLGYTYANAATARLVHDLLATVVRGRDCFDVPAAWAAMALATRNLGRPGACSMAISAVDTALWDLKAKLLGLPLVKLLGAARAAVPIYGSGGFTSYSIDQLQKQLTGWIADGISRVKMKVGARPDDDLDRVDAARVAIGDDAELYVDADGFYGRKEALAFAEEYAELGVTWFEEPVPSDDLEGLRMLRDRAPPGMNIAAGEYGFDLPYYRGMLQAGAVDVLQADATRCGGPTGFFQVCALAAAQCLPLSTHGAPALHVHTACAILPLRHMEYFHEHARIEQMFFDGAPRPVNGELRPDLARPGLGLEFKRVDAEKFAVK
jgi:L-alanine-DL-glutamate epimerase-like enolase superfamily enzyme